LLLTIFAPIMNTVRVRFAPSPTGGLHLGGVRTVLFNYLFAKKNNGKFIVRIEDTDQTRFVEGAEAYIFKTLEWCGLQPDESVLHGGQFAPYKQSERKQLYKQYAEQLVAKGKAYYAFDTATSLEEKRTAVPNFLYNHQYRNNCINSLTLTAAEVAEKISNNEPYVIRILMPTNETVAIQDMIRGHVSFDTNLVDDKVLLKADGMPTYHLAVVVDDYLMQITHAFRGEEWLPSAPVHVLLWQYLFGENAMPKWAHLPLILKPDGNGKLSKRDGERLGFPVFAMDWTDIKTNHHSIGFKERGFLPEAFINMLAMLGWNSGTEQEIFSLDELIQHFDIERVHKGGAKFDFEKAKWFNAEWIKRTDNNLLAQKVLPFLQAANIPVQSNQLLTTVVAMVKDRCTVLTDFVQQAGYFFEAPKEIDIAAIQPKWDDKKKNFFTQFAAYMQLQENINAIDAETYCKQLATECGLKLGDVMLPLRIMLVGEKFGPGVFDIVTLIGPKETVERIQKVINLL
jgi:glutamyl-tRNA synthetase